MNEIDPIDKIDPDLEITDYDDSLLSVLEMEPVTNKTLLESICI